MPATPGPSCTRTPLEGVPVWALAPTPSVSETDDREGTAEEVSDAELAGLAKALVWFVVGAIVVVTGAAMVVLLKGIVWLLPRLTLVLVLAAFAWLTHLSIRLKDLERRLKPS